MIGTILDVDPKTNAGILRAEDGQRYRFAGTEWKSGRRPANGDKVDFEVVGGAATGLYVLGGGGAPLQMPSISLPKIKGILPAGGLSLPQSGALGGAVFDDWRVLLAGLSFIACLLPYASVALQSYSLFGFVSAAGELLGQFELMRGMTRGLRGANSVDLTGIQIALNLTYLLYLIPLSAVVLVFCVVTRRPARAVAVAHGALSIFLPLFVAFVLSASLSAMIPRELQNMGGIRVGVFGAGAWVLILIGVAQLAGCFGFIKKSPRALVRSGS
jgi:hypothetical protein